MLQLQRNSSSIMTRNEFWLFLFANWRTEFENSLVLLSRVNNTFCVDFYLHNHLFDDSSSDDSELDAHTEALRDIPCRVIITILEPIYGSRITNSSGVLRSTWTKEQSILQITRTVTHSRVRCSNAAQSWVNAHITPCVWEPVYFPHSHMSQRSYWKWKIHSNEMLIYLVLHIAGDHTWSSIWIPINNISSC